MESTSRGVSSEKLMTCPYDKSHQISERRFYNHFYKCRRNWMANKALKGEQVFNLTCKYNHYHQVPEMEIAHHESTCIDRKKIRSYQVVDGVKKFFPPLYLEKLKMNEAAEEERKEMYGGLNPGLLYSAQFFGEPVTFEELQGMSSEDVRNKRESILKKKMPKEWLLRCGRMSQEEHDELVAKEEMEKKAKAAKAAAVLDSDDEEEWNKPREGPGFDFWQNIWDPNVRHASVPHCLSKVERKLFLQIHEKRWEKERQERLELQRNPRPRTVDYLPEENREWKEEMNKEEDEEEREEEVQTGPSPRVGMGRARRMRWRREGEDQVLGAVGGVRARSFAFETPPSPPLATATSSKMVAQREAFDEVDEFAGQNVGAVGGAAAFRLEKLNIADDIRNYQLDDEDWVQPGYVERNNDPYWGTGNKTDEYELTVRKVHR